MQVSERLFLTGDIFQKKMMNLPDDIGERIVSLCVEDFIRDYLKTRRSPFGAGLVIASPEIRKIATTCHERPCDAFVVAHVAISSLMKVNSMFYLWLQHADWGLFFFLCFSYYSDNRFSACDILCDTLSLHRSTWRDLFLQHGKHLCRLYAHLYDNDKSPIFHGNLHKTNFSYKTLVHAAQTVEQVGLHRVADLLPQARAKDHECSFDTLQETIRECMRLLKRVPALRRTKTLYKAYFSFLMEVSAARHTIFSLLWIHEQNMVIEQFLSDIHAESLFSHLSRSWFPLQYVDQSTQTPLEF